MELEIERPTQSYTWRVISRFFACALLAFPTVVVAAPKPAVKSQPVFQQTSKGVTLRVWRARWVKARELSYMSSEPELALEYDIVAPGARVDEGKKLSDYVLTARLNDSQNALALDETKLFRSSNDGYIPARPSALPANRGVLVWRASPRLKQFAFEWEWLMPRTEWNRKDPPTLGSAPPANFRHFRFILKREQIADFPKPQPLPAPIQSVTQGVYTLALHKWTKTKQGERAVGQFVLTRQTPVAAPPYITMSAVDEAGEKLEISNYFLGGNFLFDGSVAAPNQRPLHYEAQLKSATQKVSWKATITERPRVEDAFALDNLPVPSAGEPLNLERQFKAPNGALCIVRRIARFDAKHPLKYPPRFSGPALPTQGIAVLIEITPKSEPDFLRVKRALARDDKGKTLSAEMTMRFSFGRDLLSSEKSLLPRETVLLLAPSDGAKTFNLRLRMEEFGAETKSELDLGLIDVAKVR